MANFTSAMIALVDERDRQFLERVAQDFNLPFEQLSKLYLDVSATAIKVPRKYTKKVKSALTIVDATKYCYFFEQVFSTKMAIKLAFLRV